MRIFVKFDHFFILILLAATFLLFFNLNNRPFWQDEAETACLARNVLHYGLPRAFDGVNLVSQEGGREFDADYLWRWSPWLQIYLTAAAFKIWGASTFAGRFPFAVFGLIVVGLTYFLVRRRFGDLWWARLAAALLAFSVPFLLFSRQCRYYSLGALLSLLSLFFWRGEGRLRFAGAALLGGSLVLMFYANYLLFLSYLFALGLAAFLVYRAELSLPRILWLCLGIAILILPGLALFRIQQQAGMLDITSIWPNLEHYSSSLFQFMIPLPIVLGLLWRWRPIIWRHKLPQDPGERFVFFLGLIIFLNIVIMAPLPQCEYRYLVHLYPLAAVMLGWVVCKLARYHLFSGVLLACLLLFTNFLHILPMNWLRIGNCPYHNDSLMLTYPNIPLRLYLSELFSTYPDTNRALIQFFRNHSLPGETILITYGDLPLQFYTSCQVLGGLQDRVPPPGEFPQWVVVRWDTKWNREDELRKSEAFIRDHLNLSRDYQAVILPNEDEAYGNRADPYYHRFIPLKEHIARLVVYHLNSKAVLHVP